MKQHAVEGIAEAHLAAKEGISLTRPSMFGMALTYVDASFSIEQTCKIYGIVVSNIVKLFRGFSHATSIPAIVLLEKENHMKKTNIFKSTLFLLGLLLAIPSFGQTLLNVTTLSSAVTATDGVPIVVASATGITAGSTVIFVADSGNSGEAMFVNAVSGTTLTVQRGYQTQGKARTHLSGALVFAGPANAFGTVQPSGSCTRSNVLYLPDIAFGLGGTATTISDCIGGEWVNGTFEVYNTFTTEVFPQLGSVAYTSVGTSTATAATGDEYCSEIDVRQSKLVTGLAILVGATTNDTDLHILALYDATGNLLANSAVAGAVIPTTSENKWAKFAFTSPYYVVGPNKYYACEQGNGTTDTFRMLTTGTQDETTTKLYTGLTFGTLSNPITVPTTFSSVVGPIFYEY
jgi:hypothetical protein